MSQAQRLSAKQNEITLSTTSRPHYQSVNTVCTEDGYLRFGIDVEQVERCIGAIMVVIQDFKADEVLTALGVATTLLIKRFEFTLPGYFQFIENFLKGDDYKYNCHAMQRMIHTLYETHVSRYEKISFKERKIKF